MRLKVIEVWIKAKDVKQDSGIEKELCKSVRDFANTIETFRLKFFHESCPCGGKWESSDELRLDLLVGSRLTDDDERLKINLTSHLKRFFSSKGLRGNSDVDLRDTEWAEEDLQLERDYIRIGLLLGKKSWNEVLHDSRLPVRITSLLLEFMRNEGDIKFEGDPKEERSVVLEEPHGIVKWVQDEPESFEDIYSRIAENSPLCPAPGIVKLLLNKAVELGKLEVQGDKYQKIK